MVEPRYSMTCPAPPPVPMRPMMASTTSLAVTPAGRSPSTVTAMVAGRVLGERLGGEHVLDLARADAEGQRADGAVGRGVAVAADDGHPRLGEAQLGPDHVHDALVGVAHRVAGDAELLAVGREHLELLGRDGVGHRLVDVGRRHVVVGRRHGEVGSAHAASGQAQAVEGLGRGHLVDEVQVDEQEVGLALGVLRTTWESQTLSRRVRGASATQSPTLTMTTRSGAAGRLVLDGLPGLVPEEGHVRAGALGETTLMPSWRSSIEPTKKRWTSSSSSPS